MNRKYSKIILLAVTCIIGFIACVIVYRLINDANIEKVAVLHLWFLPFAFAISIIPQLITPLLAVLSLNSIGYYAKYIPMLWISMFAASANSTMPFPAGLPIRAVLQKRILKIPYTASASAMLIEMVISFGYTIIVCMIFSFLFFSPALFEKITFIKSPISFAIILLGLLLIVFLILLIFRRIKGRIFERLHDAYILIIHANPYKILIFLCFLIVSSSLGIIRISIVLYSVGVSVPLGVLFAAVFLSYLLGVISFVPMGLGVYDISLGSILAMLGAPIENVAAALAIDRFISIMPYLIGGVIATNVLGRDVLGISNDSKETDEINSKKN